MTTHHQLEMHRNINLGSLNAELEAAALNARNLLLVANRELLENVELGLSLIAAAERYIVDIIALNAQLCAASATVSLPAAGARGAA